jgi:hypothetical protein
MAPHQLPTVTHKQIEQIVKQPAIGAVFLSTELYVPSKAG